MQTAIQKIGDTHLLVTPDGKPIPHKNSDTPLFHIFPRLYNPFKNIGLNDIRLSKADLFLPGSKEPISVLPEEVVIRRPYPNVTMCVAGTSDRKMGWSIPLEMDNLLEWLRLEWLIQLPVKCEHNLMTIHHQFKLDFNLTQQGHVFSMDQTSTFYDPNARAVSFLDLDDIDESFTKGDESFKPYVLDESCGFGFAYFQTLNLTSCAWSDLICDQIEDMALERDVKPATEFTTYIEAHHNNACCEILAADLYNAIRLAREVIVPEEAIYFNDSEKHPAIKHICQWWNDLAPDPATWIAAQIQIDVRIADDNLYWSGMDEKPPWPIDGEWRAKSRNACARWDEYVLIEFAQSKTANFYNDHSFQVFNVAGQDFWSGDGVPSEEAKTWDFAKEGLEALRSFPERFPVAWEKLKAAL